MGNAQASSGALGVVYAKYNENTVPQYANAKINQADIDELKSVLGAGEFLGGNGGSYLGGYDALQDYGNSLFSKAKEKLIREIAEEVFSALKVSGAKNAKTAPIKDVVEHLKKLSPNPSKGKRFNDSFNSSSGKQKAVCKALAEAINNNYGGRIINMDASDAEMCNQVAEVMYSLLTGLHTEFLNVAGDVTRIMKNMQTVESALTAAYKKQVELVEASGDPRLREQSSNSAKLYNEIKAEYDRQAAILANLMNVAIGPTGKSLISSLEDNRDFAGLVRDLKAETGSTAFGDKLGHLLSGISTVAHSAELIDKALRKIGMSVNEFKSAKSAGELRGKVLNTIMKDSPNSKQLDEMMNAAQIIFNNNYDHDAISRLLSGSSKKGRGEDGEHDEHAEHAEHDEHEVAGGDSDSDNEVHEVAGGDDEDVLPTYWQKKSLSKKIANKKKYRDLVLKDFRKLLKNHYQNVVEAANALSGKVGKSIPVSDALDYFIRVFHELPNLDKENFHVALSGYTKDMGSKEKREQFLNSYLLLDQAIEPLTKGPEGNLFKNLQYAVNAMIKSINDFSDKMVKALTEIHVDRPDEIQAALKKTASLFYGSGDSGDDLFGSGSWVAFEKVKNEMKYYYAIANIKTNMARFADDIKSYSDDYEQLLGEEAGWLINNIKKEYLELINYTDPAKDFGAFPDPRPVGSRAERVHASLRAFHNLGAAHAPLAVKAHKNLVKVWTMQMNAKESMVKVAQAVDLYLKSFTDGISRHPDAVSSVVKMLEQVEIVAKWFNDKSGDNLAHLFEMFPSTNAVAGNLAQATYSYGDEAKAPVRPNGDINVPAKPHYYDYVEEQNRDKRLPGNPFRGRPLENTEEKQLEGMLNLTEKTIKGMRALENILSTFASVGSKFGDLDPQARTFMNPGQIFNALCEYVKASAYTTHFGDEARNDVDPGLGGALQPNTGNPITAALYRSKTQAAAVAVEALAPAVTIPSAYQPAHRPAGAPEGAGLHFSQDMASKRLKQLRGRQLNAADASANDANLHGILTGVHTNADGLGANADMFRCHSLAMSAIPYTSDEAAGTFWDYHNIAERGVRLDSAGWVDTFYDTDMLFQMTVKSLVAKIFTVVDAYRLFNRPTIQRETHYSLNPLRTIIGGGVKHVKIIPEAAELYLRLPLLAEWYRENYSFKGTPAPNGEDWRLSIVPSIDGVWSDFIDVVFDRASEVKEGNYTESQSQALVLSMNDIYKAYKAKYPKATIRNIINSFVLEMNRIFGFVKQREIDAYMNQRRDYLTKDQGDGNTEDFLDYDILNANDQFGTRPAPSDRFVNVGLKTNVSRRIPMQKLQAEVVRIRAKMDASFNKALVSNTNADGNPRVSFIDTLRNYKKELSTAKSDEDQYQIVLQMIQGANKAVNTNADKLIMLHEVVATPLALLYGVYKVLAKFNALTHGASIVNLADWNTKRVEAPAGGPVPPYAVTLPNNTDVRNAYKAYLVGKYDKLLETSKDMILDSMVQALAGNMAGAAINLDNCGYIIHNAAAMPALPGDRGALQNAHLDSAHLMQDILGALADLSTNSSKLVTCSVGQGGNVNLDFSPVQDLCMGLLSQVKSNVQKLRTSFPPNLVDSVDRYENKNYVGSTRWLEENLIEILFKDRDQCGLNTGYSSHLVQTMQALSKPAVAPGPITTICGYSTVDNALRGLIYYEHKAGISSMSQEIAPCNPTRFPWNVIPMKKTPVSVPELAAMTRAAADENHPAATNGDVNGIFTAPIILFETKETINSFNVKNHNTDLYGGGGGGGAVENLRFNSLLTRFNKLVHMYLYTNLEEGALKIYIPLFESFMNGAASHEVLQGKGFPNVAQMANANTNTVQQTLTGGDAQPVRAPPVSTILYASTALAMRGLATSVAVLGTVQKKKHAYDNIAEIPEFLKERMRVNLPYFSKLFQEVNDRAEFLKRVVTYTNIKNNITSCATAAGVPHADARAGVMGGATLTNTADHDTVWMTDYNNGLLTRLIELSSSIKKCCDSVYKELNDKPVPFMELSKDSIADYKRKNGVLPLMPASSLLKALVSLNLDPNGAGTSEDDVLGIMLPSSANGSNAYKFNSAAKLMLSELDAEPNLEHFPGAKEIYNMYTETTDGNLLSAAEYANTIKLVVNFAKFLNTGVLQARLYGRPQRSIALIGNEHNVGSVFSAIKWDNQHAVEAAPVGNAFAILPLIKASKLADLVELTENSNHKFSKERLAKVVGANIGNIYDDNRSALRVFNILDMNIVPINVHAFMREIPFVNVLNYSYTFDRMVHDFVLPSYVKNLRGDINENTLMIKASDDITNPRELLVKLLVHPYANLGYNSPQYFGLLASLFNGNDDLKLGRPRYLSDQLWHKTLLTSSVQLGHGNGVDNAVSPVIANTNTALGPAGYEAQRAVVKASRSHVPLRSDFTRDILMDFAATFAARLPAVQQAALIAALNAKSGGLLPVPANTAAMIANAAVSTANLAADIRALRDDLAANDMAVLNRLGIQSSRVPQDVTAFMNKLDDRAQEVNRLAGANAYLPTLIRSLISNFIAASLGGGVNNVPALQRACMAVINNAAYNPLNNLKNSIIDVLNSREFLDKGVSVINMASLEETAAAADADNAALTPVQTAVVHLIKKVCNIARGVSPSLLVTKFFETLTITVYVSTRTATAAIDPAQMRVLIRATLPNVAIPRRYNYTFTDFILAAFAENACADAALVTKVNINNEFVNNLQNLNKPALLMLDEYWNVVGNFGNGSEAERVVANKLQERAAIQFISDPVQAPGLKYRKDDRWQVVNIGGQNMDVGNVVYCAELGRMRFDTKLVRNLVWFVHLQRVIRVLLTTHLSFINTPVIRGLKIADPKVTEYESNDKFDENDYNGANYSAI